MSTSAHFPSVSIVTITKDDPDVAVTVENLLEESRRYPGDSEVLVVDATPGTPHRVDDGQVRWIAFEPRGTKATIPEQRNVGVAQSSGDVVVFIDSGCVPGPEWLRHMTAPIRDEGEQIVAGAHTASGRGSIRDHDLDFRGGSEYLREAPTINLAIVKSVFTAVGGFDESFGYGSDVDFTWRSVASGYRIRHQPSAVVSHDWGATGDDLRRSWVYGQARFKLYAKHPAHRSRVMKDDPIAVLYPLFLLAVVLSRGDRRVLATAAVPMVKNLRRRPLLTFAHNVAFGAGVLRGAWRMLAPNVP
jgi:glycosyltransferase involved in cell wall biosynthesis